MRRKLEITAIIGGFFLSYFAFWFILLYLRVIIICVYIEINGCYDCCYYMMIVVETKGKKDCILLVVYCAVPLLLVDGGGAVVVILSSSSSLVGFVLSGLAGTLTLLLGSNDDDGVVTVDSTSCF